LAARDGGDVEEAAAGRDGAGVGGGRREVDGDDLNAEENVNHL